MSTAVSNRSHFGALFGLEQLAMLESVVMSYGEEVPSLRSTLFRNVMVSSDIWRSQDILDLPLAIEIPEGTEYTFARPVQGLGKTFQPRKYGGGFAVTKEMIDDAKFDVMGAWAQKFALALRASREISAMNVYNLAFTTMLSQDGNSLINATHPIGSQNINNVIVGNPDLSEAALQAAVAQFETSFLLSNGAIRHIRPRFLVVSPFNKHYAKELVGSDLKPDTANNNLNSLKEDGLIVVSSPYLTDPDAWFLQGSPSDTGIIIAERQGIQTASSGVNEGPGFITDSAFVKGSYREEIGVSNPYGILGSSGT